MIGRNDRGVRSFTENMKGYLALDAAQKSMIISKYLLLERNYSKEFPAKFITFHIPRKIGG